MTVMLQWLLMKNHHRYKVRALAKVFLKEVFKAAAGLTGGNEDEEENVMEAASSQAVDSDSSMPCSPSILHPNEATNTQTENR